MKARKIKTLKSWGQYKVPNDCRSSFSSNNWKLILPLFFFHCSCCGGVLFCFREFNHAQLSKGELRFGLWLKLCLFLGHNDGDLLVHLGTVVRPNFSFTFSHQTGGPLVCSARRFISIFVKVFVKTEKNVTFPFVWGCIC